MARRLAERDVRYTMVVHMGCYNIAKDPVHIHDLNATILHTRDFRLTDVEGTVVKGVLA